MKITTMIEDVIEDILNSCEECGHCTLAYHSTLCSNSEHRKLAQLLLDWPGQVEEFEIEGYKDEIRNLEQEVEDLESELDEATETINLLNEKLSVWAELCSVENQK